MRLAQYRLYRAPSDAMMTSYCSFSSLLLALTCVHDHESYALRAEHRHSHRGIDLSSADWHPTFRSYFPPLWTIGG